MQLHGASASFNLFDQAAWRGCIALGGKAQIHREGIRRFNHARNVPGAGRASGGECASGWPRAATQHGGDARHQRFFNLLRADEMDVRIKATSGENLALTRNHFCSGANDNINARLDFRIACLTKFKDTPVAQAYIAFHNAPMVDHDRIGDDRVDGAFSAREL